MKFEYDINKSEINKEKHGVNFEEAKILWLVNYVIVPAITKGEVRYMIIGHIESKLYSCIFTVRKRKIRIISCRRSAEKERRIYHEKVG